jgi:hypothetical protein
MRIVIICILIRKEIKMGKGEHGVHANEESDNWSTLTFYSDVLTTLSSTGYSFGEAVDIVASGVLGAKQTSIDLSVPATIIGGLLGLFAAYGKGTTHKKRNTNNQDQSLEHSSHNTPKNIQTPMGLPLSPLRKNSHYSPYPTTHGHHSPHHKEAMTHPPENSWDKFELMGDYFAHTSAFASSFTFLFNLIITSPSTWLKIGVQALALLIGATASVADIRSCRRNLSLEKNTGKYKLLMLHEEQEIKPGHIYIRDIGGTLSYTVVTPSDEIKMDQQLPLKTPKNFDDSTLKFLLPTILSITSQRHHTQTPFDFWLNWTTTIDAISEFSSSLYWAADLVDSITNVLVMGFLSTAHVGEAVLFGIPLGFSLLALTIGTVVGIMALGGVYCHRVLSKYDDGEGNKLPDKSSLATPDIFFLIGDAVSHTSEVSAPLNFIYELASKNAVIPNWANALVKCSSTFFGGASAGSEVRSCENVLRRKNYIEQLTR